MYFADENLLGLGKLLRLNGRDVVFPGHEALPEVPRGAADADWMPVIAARGLVVLTRDRRIRRRPTEIRLFRELGIRAVWVGAKRDMGPQLQFEMFIAHEARLTREITKRGAGPWALVMTNSGIRAIGLPGVE